MEYIGTTIFIIASIALITSIYYSIRYRRELEPTKRGLFTSKMNISLGIMLVCFAILQTVTFTDQLILFNTGMIRTIITAIFFLLGLYNLYAGFRNHSYYKKLQP